MDSRKVDGYIFWLSEYLARNFQQTDGPQQIELAAKEAVNLFTEHYPFELTKNVINDFSSIENDINFRKISFYERIFQKKLSKDRIPQHINATEEERKNYVPKEYDELIFKKFDYAGTIQKNAFYQTLKNLGEPEDAKNIIDMLKNDEISIDEEAYEAFIVSISNGIYSDDNFINLQPTENRNIYSISNSYIDLSKDTDLLVSQFGTMLSG
ncbi:hypothetical protein KL86DPRO_70052 [uncultured delta proteobacterium]|uniref:Uncharacterized protein n=1 Tax=uncultured delta proteobacterium TaxID=34034 RepID=A0A212KGI3_9DELT|nr:hypothetical protein KL86DPRO_70052 [uncultured delta proteobacterium]